MDRNRKPKIVVSRCLGFQACRYDGGIIKSRGVEKLQKHSIIIPICPEISIGLGVSREPISLYKIGDEVRVIQNKTGRDLTAALKNFSYSFLESLENIHGFVLKSKSPSCGFDSTKILTDDGFELGSGVFADIVKIIHPSAVIVDELEIDDEEIYDQFIEDINMYMS
jgi:uncharacterized protein YbbK (DUF523 family)